MLPTDETWVDSSMAIRRCQQSDNDMEIQAHMKMTNTKMLQHISNIKAFLLSAEPI
jgi:hypothetical protein